MKSVTCFCFALFLIGSCSHRETAENNTDSDSFTIPFVHEYAKLFPEDTSALGFTEYDEQVRGLNSGFRTEYFNLLQKWLEKTNQKLKDKTLPLDEKVDYQIFARFLDLKLSEIKVSESESMIEFFPLTEFVFVQLNSLKNDKSHRHLARVPRFKKYVANHLARNAIADMKTIEKRFGISNTFYPHQNEINRYLSNSPKLVKGIEKLLVEADSKESWRESFELFKKQVEEFDAYIKYDMLKKARKDYALPQAYYRFLLRDKGVLWTPDELIRIGKREYDRNYKSYLRLAEQIAKKYNLTSSTPLAVLEFLKQKKLSSPEEVKEAYLKTHQELVQIIQDNNIVTLPNSQLIIKLSTPEESLSQPFPHLQLPRIYGNRGEPPIFKVPVFEKGVLPFDDFAFPAATYAVTAHEGRPGHDLQFARILESKPSLARSFFAINSTNIEGWALYAEELVEPYLSLEAKFILYQTRLWRIARMFLDPEVQKGLAGERKVENVFVDQLGVSKILATLEFRRYLFQAPGQATSYYHGFLLIKDSRRALEKKFGKRLEDQCFHDTLLSLGLIPLDMIPKFEEKFSKCLTQ